MRRVIQVFAVATSACLLAGLLSVLWVRSVMHEALPLPVTGPAVLRVPAGASAASVANNLHASGWLPRPEVFTLWARFTGDAARIRVGEYEIKPGTTPVGLLAQLVAGDVVLYPVTLLEGWTWREVRDALSASNVIKLTLDYTSAELLAEQLGLDAGHVEGQWFPDTYKVARGTTDRELLQQAAALMAEELDAAWQERADDVPLTTPYELLTLASIIERETSQDSERARVAGVFVRRLNIGMRLQTDPTVIYGLGDAFDGNLTRKHLVTDTPYNTYTRGGLPPTPIALPGAASLRAAANPADGDALYFVASAELDGSHVFSVTLEEHNAAVAAYIAGLRRARINNKD